MTRVDPDALDRAVAAGRPAQEAAATVGGVLELRDTVRARCGERAVIGTGVEELRALAGHVAETDRLVVDVRVAVVAADRAPWLAPPAPTGRPGGGQRRLAHVRAVERTRLPWLDPDTDSLVVGLVRTVAGGGASTELVGELRRVAPDVIRALTNTEMSSVGQAATLLAEPGRFADNWRRAGAGAVDATVALSVALAGIASSLTPGADEAVESVLGRRPGTELQGAALRALHLAAVDPDAAAASAIGAETFRDDPYRWLGSMLPEAAVEAVTAAIPLTAMRGARLLEPPPPAPAPRSLLLGPPSRSTPGPGLGDGPGAPPRAAGQGDAPLPDLDETRRLEPEWGPVDDVRSHRHSPFEPPESWVGDVNGDGFDTPGRNNNCVDCARAVEANWRGLDAVAAPLTDTHRSGVAIERIEDWTGGRLAPATLDEIAERLDDLGPGSSAIVASAWDSGGAHAYNAVNDGGVVKWVDAQLGRTSTWPPPYADEIDATLVVFLDPDGRPR